MFQVEGPVICGPHAIALDVRKLSGPVTLGFRAEDATITAPQDGPMTVPVYSFEHLGDATLVSVRAGASLFVVKTGKEFRARIGDAIGFAVASSHCHLFDRKTGERLDY